MQAADQDTINKCEVVFSTSYNFEFAWGHNIEAREATKGGILLPKTEKAELNTSQNEHLSEAARDRIPRSLLGTTTLKPDLHPKFYLPR